MYHDSHHRQTHSPTNVDPGLPEPAKLNAMNTQPQTLPYLLTTEHGMPMSQLVIKGSGLRFTQTIADGLRAGGIWLVMQDKCGTVAMAKGDIMMLAHIDAVDWLSDRQIVLNLHIQAEGILHHDAAYASTTRLQGETIALWSQATLGSPASPLPALDTHDVLVTRLLQSWQAQGRSLPDDHQAFPMTYPPHWICWRWLEILPISLATKQRLLKHPTPLLCMRYIKKIIRHSDLSVQPLR
ncbi:hypothetical protein ACFFLZ_08390 [Photobacterium aphoticum]|nr:hypothetical protein [Photobacterium aphoticum]GHA45627.1 hypothetical protein GCM10007086_19000 [Photobacterium aphoticum]